MKQIQINSHPNQNWKLWLQVCGFPDLNGKTKGWPWHLNYTCLPTRWDQLLSKYVQERTANETCTELCPGLSSDRTIASSFISELLFCTELLYYIPPWCYFIEQQYINISNKQRLRCYIHLQKYCYANCIVEVKQLLVPWPQIVQLQQLLIPLSAYQRLQLCIHYSFNANSKHVLSLREFWAL